MLAWSARVGDDQHVFGSSVAITNLDEPTDKPISWRLVFLSAVHRKLGPGLPLSHHGWPCLRSCSPGHLFLQEQDQRLPLAWKSPPAWRVCTWGLWAGGSDCRGFHYWGLVSGPEDLRVSEINSMLAERIQVVTHVVTSQLTYSLKIHFAQKNTSYHTWHCKAQCFQRLELWSWI